MNQYWFIAFIIWTVAVFFGGVYVDHKFHLAAETLTAEADTKKAQEGQNEIIKFNTQIQKVYVKVKSPCLNEPVPTDVQKLLR